jgi:hypothetical protein
MEPSREKLIALVLGDLPPAEAFELEGLIAADSSLEAQRDVLARQIEAIRAVPAEYPSDVAVARVLAAAAAMDLHDQEEKLGRVISMRSVVTVYLPRVAAIAVFALLVGLTAMVLPEGPAPAVGTVVARDGVSKIVTAGELVEARLAIPLTLKTRTAGVLMDGGSAVSLADDAAVPAIVLDRGRVVVDARGAAQVVQAGEQRIEIPRGSIVAIERDREHAQIRGDGAEVVVQRETISRVLPLARGEYGLVLDDRDLPRAVRDQRVSFSGTNLDAEGFKQSFAQAASAYGVRIEGSRLIYEQGTPHRVGVSDEPEVVRVELVEGSATCFGAGRELQLGGETVSVSMTRSKVLPEQDAAPERAFGWARGMGHAVLDQRLGNMRDAGATLPAGAVIYPDRLVLPEGEERIFLLEGPDFTFPLPGGMRGRLVGTMSSGALFELQDSPIRVFVPHSRAISRD